MHGYRDDLPGVGIPENAVAAPSRTQLAETVFLERANQLGPRHSLDPESKRWVLSIWSTS
jgi:hypothetical protein